MGQAVYYATIGICIFGCVSRILLSGYYRLAIRALKCMKSTKNRGMKKLKEKFILRYQAMLGVQNVEYFVGRFLAEKRFLLLPLGIWNGLHIQFVSACLLLGSLAALYCCIEGGETKQVLMAMFQGIWTGTMLLLVDGFCMIPAKTETLKEGLCDYLENYLKVRLEHEYEVWGKNREELRQTAPVLEAQLRVLDETAYVKEKKAEKKKKKQERMQTKESKVRKDVVMLKQEVAERRKKTAEREAAEQETSMREVLERENREYHVNRQLDALIAELSLHA